MTTMQANRREASLKTAVGLAVLLAAAIFMSVLAARTDNLQGAGIRSSTYGRPNDPGPGYWARTGVEIAAKFPGAKPEAIWIVSRLKDRDAEHRDADLGGLLGPGRLPARPVQRGSRPSN